MIMDAGNHWLRDFGLDINKILEISFQVKI
jgi:hypothetical protein